MRAATRVGMVFVGPAMGHTQVETHPNFVAQAVKPEPQIQQRRAVLQQGLAKHLIWLKQQVVAAANAEESNYWQKVLNGLRGGIG